MLLRSLAAAAALLLLPGCGGLDLAAPAPAPTRAPAVAEAAPVADEPDGSPEGAALIATLRARTDVRTRPGGPLLVRQGDRTEEGTRQRLLVLQDDGDWLQVGLPGRPNGRTGWVRAGDVDLSATDWRLKVSLSKRTLEVVRGYLTVSTHPVAIGKPGTPTPTGTYWVTDLLQPPDPDGPYGPYAFGLSAYSDVVTSFGGGEGQIGLHGTDAPSSVGTAASSGCLRIANDVVRALTRDLPLGTPVEVTA